MLVFCFLLFVHLFFYKMKTGEVCRALEKKKRRVPAFPSQESCRISKACLMLLRFRCQIKKTKLSSYWRFRFLLIEQRYEMASWTMAAPSIFPQIFWDKKHLVLPSFLPHLSHFPLCSCLLLWPPCSFRLGHMVFIWLLSKLQEYRWQIWTQPPWWWPLASVPHPLESLGPLGLAWYGMSQWLNHCRSSGQPGPSPDLALLNLAEVQFFPNWLLAALCNEIRMDFTWAVLWVALSSFVRF